MPIRCEIVTQERLVYSEDVDIVNLPGIEGRMGILPHHSLLLTVLDFGEVVVRRGGVEEYFAIGGGIAEVQPDKVIILADSAEQADEIDEERAAAARARTLEAMAEPGKGDASSYRMIEAALRRANLRIDVRRRRRPQRAVPRFAGEDEE